MVASLKWLRLVIRKDSAVETNPTQTLVSAERDKRIKGGIKAEFGITSQVRNPVDLKNRVSCLSINLRFKARFFRSRRCFNL